MSCPPQRENKSVRPVWTARFFQEKSSRIGDYFMKILVISGFLGAGKTTFIKALADKTDKKFVVMENEYGEVGIDGGFLASGAGQEEMKV